MFSFTALLTTSETSGLKASGKIKFSLNWSSGTREAIALAAANFISSVICFARPSRAPLKIPGKATTLLT